MPVVAGTGRIDVFTEAQNDRTLLGIDAIDAAADPDGPDNDQKTRKSLAETRGAGPSTTHAGATKERRQATLNIAQNIVQVVLLLVRVIPRIAFLAAGFVPSHA